MYASSAVRARLKMALLTLGTWNPIPYRDRALFHALAPESVRGNRRVAQREEVLSNDFVNKELKLRRIKRLEELKLRRLAAGGVVLKRAVGGRLSQSVRRIILDEFAA